MEVQNKNGKGLIVTIVFLLILVIVLGGYIGYDKFLNNDTTSTCKEDSENNNNVKNEVTNTNNEEDNLITKGECPLTKFDSNYVLTDNDKEEIIASLGLINTGYTKQTIDINSFKIYVSESGYYFSVDFDSIPSGNGAFAYVAKVNDKLKVIESGSGDTEDGLRRMESTLESICK